MAVEYIEVADEAFRVLRTVAVPSTLRADTFSRRIEEAIGQLMGVHVKVKAGRGKAARRLAERDGYAWRIEGIWEKW